MKKHQRLIPTFLGRRETRAKSYCHDFTNTCSRSDFERLAAMSTCEVAKQSCLKRKYNIILKSLSLYFKNPWHLLEPKIIILIEKKN